VGLSRFDSRPALRSRKAMVLSSAKQAMPWSVELEGVRTGLVAAHMSAAAAVAALVRGARRRSSAIAVALDSARLGLGDGLHGRSGRLISLDVVACKVEEKKDASASLMRCCD
jgi:hypothetical protein